MRPVRPEKLPLVRPLLQRRFIVMDAGESNELLGWIDDDGTCDAHHNIGEDGKTWNTRSHSYRDEKGNVWAIRCPVSIADDEWIRVHADEPKGEWFRILKRLRENKQAQTGKRKRAIESVATWIAATSVAAARIWQ